jgi:hypothetical protein
MDNIVELCNKLDSDISEYIDEINRTLTVSFDDPAPISLKSSELLRIAYSRIRLIKIKNEIINLEKEISNDRIEKSIRSLELIEKYVYNIIDNAEDVSAEILNKSNEKIDSLLSIANSIRELLVIGVELQGIRETKVIAM